MSNFKLCVYCGASPGQDPAYARAAQEMARALAARGLTLVYGGGSRGLMGMLADAMLAHGGQVIGVIPQALQEKELAHRGLSELYVVPDMHQRKAMMANLADGFIALPGGLGTLEELFEMLTWRQLGFHAKPVGVLNCQGFYDQMLQFLNTVAAQGFIRSEHSSLLQVDTDPDALLAKMLASH